MATIGFAAGRCLLCENRRNQAGDTSRASIMAIFPRRPFYWRHFPHFPQVNLKVRDRSADSRICIRNERQWRQSSYGTRLWYQLGLFPNRYPVPIEIVYYSNVISYHYNTVRVCIMHFRHGLIISVYLTFCVLKQTLNYVQCENRCIRNKADQYLINIFHNFLLVVFFLQFSFRSSSTNLDQRIFFTIFAHLSNRETPPD